VSLNVDEPQHLADWLKSDRDRKIAEQVRNEARVRRSEHAEFADWNPELHPRGDHGRFGHGFGTLKAHLAHVESGLEAGRHEHVGPEELSGLLEDFATLARTVNLAKLHVNGAGNEHCFDTHLREIPREQMPQLPENVAGLKAFTDRLGQRGISAQLVRMDPRQLRMTQDELDAHKVASIFESIRQGGWREDSVILASREGAILDGHHRWAAVSSAEISGMGLQVNVLRIDMGIDDLLEVSELFSGPHQALGAAMPASEFAEVVLRTVRFDQAPTTPPPNPNQPWIWVGSHWLLVGTDTSDAVPSSLRHLPGRFAEFADWKPELHPRGEHGKFGLGLHGILHQGTQTELDDDQRQKAEAYLKSRGVSVDEMRQGLQEYWEDAQKTSAVAQGKAWYPNANRIAADLGKKYGVPARRAAAVIAALSPRMSWDRNVQIAGAVLNAYAKDPNVTVDHFRGKIPALPVNLEMALKMARGADPRTALTGAKRRAFYANIVAPNVKGPVTVDGHMAQMMLSKLSTKDVAVITGHQQAKAKVSTEDIYALMGDLIREQAQAVGVSPEEYQAVTWVEYNNQGGAKGHHKRTAAATGAT
jgi:hypothetical protein